MGVRGEPAAVRGMRAALRDRGLLVLTLIFLVSLPLVTVRVYATDEIEYFSYLRSLWFDRDLNFENEYLHFYQSDPRKYADFKRDLLDKRMPNTGLPINVAPIGSALLWAPFYGIADGLVRLLRAFGSTLPADGFSWPYIAAVCYGSAFYGFLGLALAYLTTRRWVPEVSALPVTLVLWWGTPLAFYMYVTPPMSHAGSFFMVTALLTYWVRTMGSSSIYRWIILGVLVGITAMVREQDALFASVVGVEVLKNLIEALRNRTLAAAVRWTGLSLVSATSALLAFAPQMVSYWVLGGRIGPSPIVAQKLQWTSPYLLPVLFSPSHGLVFWSPAWLLVPLGLVILFRRDRTVATAFALALICQAYVGGAFQTWSAAGSFGARRFVGSSFVLLVALALTFDLLRKRRASVVGYVAGILLTVFNLSMAIQWSALWTQVERQGIDWGVFIRNEFEVLPGRVGEIIYRFLFARSSFFR